MNREKLIARLAALRAHIDRELGQLLADLERPRGKSGRDVPDCDQCAQAWTSCACDPNAPEHVRHVDCLLRTGVGAETIAEAESLTHPKD